MQRVANCLLVNGSQALLLQKPSKGWWVAPGGKMEIGESIKESVDREFREETGLHLKNTILKSVITMVVKDKEEVLSEWMMFTFKATGFDGKQCKESPEGILKWVEIKDILSLPMAEGDVYLFRHLLEGEGVMYGTFYYSPDFKLLSYRLDPKPD
ncbi:NUDIX hydrolase [Bacillus solitudinis]|uniref:NUDIX hydrolase n=1 Tax=Bacillus solitudinis TaxID=2014074 RepID=UPI000C234E0A|nr:8-oxo-dGTP diphosphatase [Bacillus solitudinis]